MSLAPGTRVGDYEVLGRLGAGGMGEVYRARDTKLGRDVAIKVLPAAVGDDRERLARFRHEAQVLASLNHPHIGAIFGLEESSGVPALVLELVEGPTLSERIARGAMPLAGALLIGSQIADALEAAHERGVVHRDLKPANVKVRPDGTVKVLDFGLAKAIDASRTGGAAAAADRTTALTQEGAIVGTAPYMSPEQARGEAVDKRTDIWAFGCVLFEMLSGRAAFPGRTVSDTLVAVLDREPPWAQLPPTTPQAVRQLLRRCLEKDRVRRLRDIGDARLMIDDTRTEASLEPETSSARRLPSVPIGVAILATLVAAGVAWLAGARGPSATPTLAAQADLSLAPLTSDPGFEGDPTFAPDGETVAYVSDRTGNFDIFLKQASGGRDLNLTDDDADDVQPAFSPDGRQIAFVSSRAGGSAIQFMGTDYPLMGGGIWVMPALGGSARRIVERGNFPSWSPDSQYILFTVGPWFGKRIYRVPALGGTPEEIPVTLTPTQHWMHPSYSPDGRHITFEASLSDIYTVSSAGGEPRRVARGHHPIWSASGLAIIYSSETNYSLWQVPISQADGSATGPSQPLTIGRGRDVPGAVSRDGTRVAFTAQEQSFNLEVMPFDAEGGRETGRPEPLTAGNQLIFFLGFSPDARSVVFDSRRGAQSTIFRVDRGEPPLPLTADASFDDSSPRWSPDGRTILFNRRSKSSGSTFDLWRMAADGGNPERLVEDVISGVNRWVPNSTQAVYHKAGQLYRLDLGSRQSVQLTNEPRVMPIMEVSPDGQSVVFQSAAGGTVDLKAVSISGGPSRTVVASPKEDYHPFFSPSGRWLYYQPDHKNLVRVPGPADNWRVAVPQQVTHFPESGLLLEDAQASRDGRQLGFSFGHTTGDVWILELGQRKR